MTYKEEIVKLIIQLWFKLKEFSKECWRVLKVTRKPSTVEFKTIVKVSALGIAVIGLVGFLLQMIKQLMGI